MDLFTEEHLAGHLHAPSVGMSAGTVPVLQKGQEGGAVVPSSAPGLAEAQLLGSMTISGEGQGPNGTLTQKSQSE